MNNNLSNDDLSPLDKFKENNFVDDFVKEIQNCIDKMQSSKLASCLPKTTILTFAKYDKNFAVCFDYKEKKIYYIPKEKIVGNLPQVGEPLKFYSNDKFYVDYTGIVAEENKIEDYLKECVIAK